MGSVDEVFLVALRAVQIMVTAYAIYAVWKWKESLHGTADMFLPLLVILMVLSPLNFLYIGRAAALDSDLMAWAYAIFDLVIPLTIIKLTGHAWCWPFCAQPKNRSTT